MKLRLCSPSLWASRKKILLRRVFFTSTVKTFSALKRCHWIVKRLTVRNTSTIWKESVLLSVFEADILSNTRPFVDGLRNSFWSINLFRPLKAINHETVLPFSLLPKFFDCEFKIAEDWWTRSPPRKILSNFAKTKGLAKIFSKKIHEWFMHILSFFLGQWLQLFVKTFNKGNLRIWTGYYV